MGQPLRISRRAKQLRRVESLEPRVLLASDLELLGSPLNSAHGPACGCSACSGCSLPHQEGPFTLEDGHFWGDGHDHSLEFFRDSKGNPYFFDPAPELGSSGDGKDGGGGGSTGGDGREDLNVPILHSNSSASRKIFLDFDGQIISGTAWNDSFNNGNPIHAPAFDLDGDIFSFNSVELARIEEIFHRVAEDFAPYDVDVTTEDPGSAFFAAGRQGIRAMISTDRDEVALGGTGNRWFSGAGGVAYLNSWNWNSDTPVWVFENNLGGGAKNIAEASSHEVGHAVGLSHDGVSGGSAYYSGHGVGATSWAPIMGVGYDRNVTQWSRGEYNNANNTENDLAIISTKIPYRADDHSSLPLDFSAATPLVQTGETTVDVAGMIGRTTDIDVFSFEAVGVTSVNLLATPAAIGANLDIQMTLYDSSGNVVASENPDMSLAASLNLNVSSGSYTLAIDGVGRGNPLTTGYTDYGSLGFFSITGSIEYADPVPGGPVVVGPPTLNSASIPTEVLILFNQPLEPTSVSLDDVTRFEAPDGSDLRAQLTGVDLPAADQLRLVFAPLNQVGSYTITLGPEIYDIEGLAMDQNQNGIPGELDDDFTFTVDATPDTRLGVGPRILGLPLLSDPRAPEHVEFQFDQPMDTTSFALATDVGFLFGPLGNMTTRITDFSWVALDTLRLDFDAPLESGSYVISIGPSIRDIEGLDMDQNQNGIVGETIGDTYVEGFDVLGSVTGDFNNDGQIDVLDIDLLFEAIRGGNHPGDFDLTGDGLVDLGDRDELVINIIGTLLGDANLDFFVDTSDFNLWNANKFTSGAGWGGGDFNADGFSDTSDFNIWNSNKFQSASGLTSAPGDPIAPIVALAPARPGIPLQPGIRGADKSAPQENLQTLASRESRWAAAAARPTLRSLSAFQATILKSPDASIRSDRPEPGPFAGRVDAFWAQFGT